MQKLLRIRSDDSNLVYLLEVNTSRGQSITHNETYQELILVCLDAFIFELSSYSTKRNIKQMVSRRYLLSMNTVKTLYFVKH